MEDSMFVYSRPSLQWTKYCKFGVKEDSLMEIRIVMMTMTKMKVALTSGSKYCQSPLVRVCCEVLCDCHAMPILRKYCFQDKFLKWSPHLLFLQMQEFCESFAWIINFLLQPPPYAFRYCAKQLFCLPFYVRGCPNIT